MAQPQRNRKSTRLEGYDYTRNGAYFVTICTHQRLHLFGHIAEGIMHLNTYGQIAHDEWQHTVDLRPDVILDAWVVMPNHTHAIIVITTPHDTPSGTDAMGENVGTGAMHENGCTGAMHCAPTKRGVTPNNVAPGSLGAIVRAYKAAVTRRINRLPDTPENPIWQRNYHDHIIRNEGRLDFIRSYVVHNPALWTEDSLYS